MTYLIKCFALLPVAIFQTLLWRVLIPGLNKTFSTGEWRKAEVWAAAAEVWNISLEKKDNLKCILGIKYVFSLFFLQYKNCLRINARDDIWKDPPLKFKIKIKNSCRDNIWKDHSSKLKLKLKNAVTNSFEKGKHIR